MPATVIVNNFTVVHKTSGGTAIAGPDVCKTPTPSGPVPLPYFNTALSRQLRRGSKSVRADGQPAMLKSSDISRSTGDEPGTLGGVISGKSGGKGLPRSYSLDVKFEGQPVVRFTDLLAQNAGAAPNTAGILSQPNATALDLKFYRQELIELRWSQQKLCCGDPVVLRVRTSGADANQDIKVFLKRTDEGKPCTMESVDVTIKGDQGELHWLARWRGPFAETVPVLATQRTLHGADKSVNSLELQNPPATGRVKGSRRVMETPKYALDENTKQLVLTSDFFRWRVAYDVEIFEGRMIVWRDLDFVPRSGQGPVDGATFREWARQIEVVWDNKFYLHRASCRRYLDCDCGIIGCCKYPLRIYAVRGKQHGPINLWVGAPKQKDADKRDLWWRSHTWWTEIGEAPQQVRAHEFGHLIGCYDEYETGACDPDRRITFSADSIMGYGDLVHPRHVDEFRRRFEKLCPQVGRLSLRRIAT